MVVLTCFVIEGRLTRSRGKHEWRGDAMGRMVLARSLSLEKAARHRKGGQWFRACSRKVYGLSWRSVVRGGGGCV